MDFKKLFRRRQKENETTGMKSESGIYKFLDKEGFYIVLFLCVCIVATTAVWVTKTNIDRLATEDLMPPKLEQDIKELEKAGEDLSPGLESPPSERQEPSSIVIETIEEPDESIPTVSPQKPVVETVKSAQQKKSNQETVAVISQKAQPAAEGPEQGKVSMALPLKGKAGMKFAKDSLVYCKTLDQYTTHDGIDILAPLNTPVMAAMDGEVIEVLVDSRLGITIALSHAGDIITRYSNLSTNQMVKVGDFVEKGQVISGVGKSALFKSGQEPLLHFQVLVDGEYVDPAQYIPIK